MMGIYILLTIWKLKNYSTKIWELEVINKHLYNVFSGNFPKFIDPKMIRAAMSPLAEAQQLATLWMESYFDRFVLFCSCTLYVTHSIIFYLRFGDHAPNKDLTKISVVEKQEIFTLYVRDLGEKAALIDIKRFYEIWNVIFPKIDDDVF